jgi:hypothetical protein
VLLLLQSALCNADMDMAVLQHTDHLLMSYVCVCPLQRL